MSELRYNAITGDWVVFENKSGKRPEDFKNQISQEGISREHDPDCPLCHSNLDKLNVVKEFTKQEVDDPIVCVHPNTFVNNDEEKNWRLSGTQRSQKGFGEHYVVIDSPKHNELLYMMSIDRVHKLLKKYKDIYDWLQNKPELKTLLIFKNEGKFSSSEYGHSYTEILGLPFVTSQIRSRINYAMQAYDTTGDCMFCRIMNEELLSGERIVLETDHFLAFLPFAALSEFHLWIMPKRHSSTYSFITSEEIYDLSVLLKKVMTKLDKAFSTVNCNIVFRSLLETWRMPDYFHWYIAVVPRLKGQAGLEMGTGLFRNSLFPEESADYLRSFNVE